MSRFQGVNLPDDVQARKMGLDLLQKINTVSEESVTLLTGGYYPVGIGTPVASLAGAITPTGPIFHVTGVAAITGINVPAGFSGQITVIPDGIFTWTTAGNIFLAGTAVVGKAIIFTYDSTTKKWYPSYT